MTVTATPGTTSSASGYAALDPCVHCGFCLPACPTYLVTGDEADSPRGRIVLMRALERGEEGSDDPSLVQHLDACLGCRGCEPVCPSGVGYGRGLEAARVQLARERGLPWRVRAVLSVFRHEWLWRPVFTVGRWLRDLGIAAPLAGSDRVGFSMGMLAATRADEGGRGRTRADEGGHVARRAEALLASERPSAFLRPRPPSSAPTVALFRGCVMDALFDHVHEATRRTLEANGYEVIEVLGQGCCGALHEHAGDRDGATALARENVAAFTDDLARADYVVVNSAGCGAMLKDYGHLLGSDAAEALAARVRDVTELLAAAGPRPGGPLPVDVVYDAPCHLQHAQRVHAAPLAVLSAIPGLRLRLLPGSDKCCGSAGVYSILQPAMSRRVLDAKIAELAAATPRPALVATGNPGCLMQIGGGLRAAGLDIAVAHPVELLDRSYAIGGVYRRAD